MIRIDEIYCNTFLPRMQAQPWHGMHWFDPFGSVQFTDLCSQPPVPWNDRAHRYLFWDQEPLHRDLIDQTLTEYCNMYNGTLNIVTSEHCSENVEYVKNTYGLKPFYYFFHGWAALDWYRGYNRTFLSIPYQERVIEHLLLCPNNIIGGRRKHRLELLNEFVNYNLISDNLVSFPERCPHENQSVNDLCDLYQLPRPQIQLPLVIDNIQNHHNNSHCLDLWSWSNKSLLQVVTETVYSGQRHHLTEKSFKPIAMCQPFVIVSCQGSLEYLRSYGFKTFGDFWDESYDEAPDNLRIKKIAELLYNLNSLSKKELQQLHQAMQSTVEHNYNHFYSGAFENKYLWPELTAMMEAMGV